MKIVAEPHNPAERADLAGAARVAVWVLGISLLVLLIACANVANLSADGLPYWCWSRR